MGTWSLDHAVALRDAGIKVHVASLTPAIPKLANRLVPSIKTYTECPHSTVLSGITIDYPRWCCYPIKQFWTTLSRSPNLLLSFGWRTAKKRMDAIVEKFRPDVVLANHSLVNGFVAYKLKETHGIPFVTVDHEVGDFHVCRENRGWNRIMKQVATASSAGITVSEAMKRIASDVVPGANFQTIYNGTSFAPCDPSLLDRHRKKDSISIFCCGNLYGRKDIPLLINAFNRVALKFPNASLRIAGDGPDRTAIETLINGLPSRNQIRLLGSIEHADVQREMQAADIFALVGWAEPFGVVFLEAMANGCPVVVSEDAGVAELLSDGESAAFTKPQNLESVVSSLESLMNSHEHRVSVARGGYELFKNSCRWSHRAKEYQAVLSEAIK